MPLVAALAATAALQLSAHAVPVELVNAILMWAGRDARSVVVDDDVQRRLLNGHGLTRSGRDGELVVPAGGCFLPAGPGPHRVVVRVARSGELEREQLDRAG